MGVVPLRPPAPVIFHDTPPFNWKPWAFGSAFLLLLAMFAYVRFSSPTTIVDRYVKSDEPPHAVSSSASAGLVTTSFEKEPPTSQTVFVPVPAKPAPAASSTPAAPQDSTDDQSDEAGTPQIPEPTPTGIRLNSAELASQDDGIGDEFAVGRLSITNTSSYPVSSYSITVTSDGGVFQLTPVVSPNGEELPPQNRTIQPGQTIELPVMSNDVYTNNDPSASKTVIVQATVNGTRVTDSTTIQ